MQTEPMIVHMNQMLRELRPEPFRAVYMVTKELYELQKTSQNIG